MTVNPVRGFESHRLRHKTLGNTQFPSGFSLLDIESCLIQNPKWCLSGKRRESNFSLLYDILLPFEIIQTPPSAIADSGFLVRCGTLLHGRFPHCAVMITVPLLYQISMDHHAFSLKFILPENQEKQSKSAFIETDSHSLSYETTASGLDTKFHICKAPFAVFRSFST